MIKESDVFFDDIEIKELNVRMLLGHDHPLIPNTRDRFVYIPGADGAYDYGADLDPIPFLLPLEIRDRDRVKVQQTVRKLKTFLFDGNRKPKTFKLRFGYEPDKYYNVRYSGQTPIERLITTGKFTLPLTCFEGYAHSVVKNNEITWGSTILTFTAPYTLGHSGDGSKTFNSPGTTTISVVGTNLRPTILVDGSGNDVTISWDDKTMELGSFTDTEWVIDLEEFEVTRNGLYAINDIKGNWLDMELQQGENTIYVNGSGLDLNLRFEFRDRF